MPQISSPFHSIMHYCFNYLNVVGGHFILYDMCRIQKSMKELNIKQNSCNNIFYGFEIIRRRIIHTFTFKPKLGKYLEY